MLLDTNVVVRHLTGEPVEQARRVKRMLAAACAPMHVVDVVVAESVYVLESFYGFERRRIVGALVRFVASPAVTVADRELVVDALRRYAEKRIAFADAYLAACAEQLDVSVVSFDRDFDRLDGVRRVEPR